MINFFSNIQQLLKLCEVPDRRHTYSGMLAKARLYIFKHVNERIFIFFIFWQFNMMHKLKQLKTGGVKSSKSIIKLPEQISKKVHV